MGRDITLLAPSNKPKQRPNAFAELLPIWPICLETGNHTPAKNPAPIKQTMRDAVKKSRMVAHGDGGLSHYRPISGDKAEN
jgi:hypothetical protein